MSLIYSIGIVFAVRSKIKSYATLESASEIAMMPSTQAMTLRLMSWTRQKTVMTTKSC